jgi:predicted MFS family arabinose efflux permease
VNFAVVRLNPSAPAAATSITQSGVYAGGCIGPLGFGTLVQLTSYSTAWLISGILMGVAAALMYIGTRMLAKGEKSLAGTVLPASR